MANFQKIPYKERMRHIKYRDKQLERVEERHEEEMIRKMIAEKEAAMRQESSPKSDKEHEDLLEELRRHGLIEREDD